MHLFSRHLFFQVTLLSLFSLGFFLAPPLFAAETPDASSSVKPGLRLITSPLPINLVTEPGKTVTTELKVKNGGTQKETLKIDLMKFKAYEESGKPQLLEREAGDDFLDWVTFSQPTFTLAPDEWKTITATFTVPSTASFGYYYALVFSRAEEVKPANISETSLVGGTAILVLLEARVPDAKREIVVTEFSLDKQFYEFLPTTFNVKLKNTGSVHIAPRGNIFINQGDTKDVALLEVNSEKGNILPNSSRTFDTKWNDGFPVYQEKVQDGKTVFDEKGNPEYELKWNFKDASKLRFGKYTAKLLLIYDDGHRDVPVEGEVSFWVIPWRLLIVLSIIALFFFIGFRSTVRNIWHKIFKRKKQ